MKTLLLTLIALFAVTETALATVYTVSNHIAGGAQYTNLRDAYDAATNGDTLLLEGTDINYHISYQCNFHWNKELTVIGIGFNPSKQNPKRTKITATHCNEGHAFHIGNAGSGSEFYGIEFMNEVRVYETSNNLLFENCKFNLRLYFQDGASTTGLAIINCIFDANNDRVLDFGGAGAQVTALINNCVFDGYIFGNGSQYVSASIEHCLFLSPSVNAFSNLHDAQIKNNIFVNRLPAGSFNSDYQNNICAVMGTLPPDPGDGNTGTGNIENTDPQFVNYTFGEYYSPFHDYEVQASAALGGASNGSDIGVHGGTTNFSETGEVLIAPIVRSVNIQNTSVAPNGTLNVEIHATAPSDN